MSELPGYSEVPHLPVLYHEIITALRPISPKRYLDGTLGAGGHSAGILAASAPHGKLLGLDLDPQALALASQRLSSYGERAMLVQASYRQLDEVMAEAGWESVHGIVFDLGVSSMQVDTPDRGFSFQTDGPLDMRFGPTQRLTAGQVVNQWDETDLAEILWKYGEEQLARRIARAIVQNRPYQTTLQLAAVIKRAAGRQGQSYRIHPATRSFQALRIAVNDELNAIEETLPKAVAALEPGGRLAVISFHSLEDRLVKQFMRRESRDCICPPEQPVCVCGHRASIKEINRHPIVATQEEINGNPRARSAKLRVAEKLS